MSDTLSTVTGLATGGLLLLDSFVFTEFALPEKVRFGGAEQMTIHKLPGGNRVFDTTGPDPVAIAWSGMFLGPLSEVQRRALEAIRDAAQPVDLIVGFQSWLVMVRDLQFEQGHLRVDYQIQCEVVPDPGPEEDDDLGTGEAPGTPQKAQEQGQAKVAAARKIAAKMPGPVPSAGSEVHDKNLNVNAGTLLG